MGLIAAVVAIGLKIALGFGAAHFLSHGSGSGIVITLVVVIVLGFVLRRIRF